MKQSETHSYYYLIDEPSTRYYYCGLMDVKCGLCKPEGINQMENDNFEFELDGFRFVMHDGQLDVNEMMYEIEDCFGFYALARAYWKLINLK